jgi:hypothetical protein
VLLQDHKAAAAAYEDAFNSLCLSKEKGPDAQQVFHEAYAIMSGVQVAAHLAQVSNRREGGKQASSMSVHAQGAL